MRVRRIAATTTAAALVAASAWSAAPAAAATAGELVAAILAPSAASFVTGSSLASPSGNATWVRTAPAAGFPSRTGGSYAMLSTGQASVLDQYSSSYEASTPWSSSTTRGGAYDVTTLSVTLDVPATANCLLGVTFRFLTEEFPDFTGGTYNDAFVAEVGESTWRIEGTTIVAPNNFAFDPSGRVISVNSGLFDSDTAAAEATGTIFGGATPKLTAQVPLTPGTRQTLHFSIFDQGDGDLDSAVLLDNLRIGAVGDPGTQCVAGATTNPLETLVSASAPAKNDVSGTADDTYTIPSSEGITYSVGGSPVAAGTYPGSGTVVVTATALPGYVLAGASQFTLVFTDVADVTATEPTWTDVSGTANDTYTIPSVTGVQYSVGGTPVAAGPSPATGTVTVDAAAASSSYSLTGTSRFTHTFSSLVDVTAVEPTWYDTYGTALDTVTIPSVPGVQYSVGGTPLAAGTYGIGGSLSLTVTAAATPGYVLTGPSQFSYTFTDIRQVTATVPTWQDAYGTEDDGYVIPTVEGVQYSVDGTPVSAGRYPATGTVTVDATALSGYVLSGPSQFTHTFTNIVQVGATAPTSFDTYGTADDTYTIPSVTGVQYSVDGSPVDPGTYPGTGTVVITATATEGHELTGPSSFTFTFTNIVLATAVEPTWTDTYGTASDTYLIPSVTGVQYRVGGVVVPPGVHAASGTVVVTATAEPGYELSGASQFSHTFTDIRLVTATEPSWTDGYGTEDDSYTIPSVAGVQYSVDGTPVAAGTYPAAGTVVVDAAATAGYELSGASQFTRTFTDIRLVSATTPTWTDTYGTDDDTYTIPSVTGVQYSIDGAPVAAGTYPGSGTVVVDAAAVTGYELSGASQFTHTFTDIRLVTATAPTQTDTYGTDDDTYTIPSVTGVEYSVDGDPVAAGTHPGSGTVVVTATATAGYELSGVSQFTLVFTNIVLVTPVAPTWTDVDGTASDAYTIPAVDGVVYTVGGGVVAPGTHPASGTVTVVATAAPGYELTGTTVFSHAFTDLTHVSALAPTTRDEPGTARDRVTIPAVAGVTYLLDGTTIPAGSHALTGDLVVTAQAADARHVLVGTSRFELHLSDADVPGQPVVSATAGSGSVDLAWSVPAGAPTGYDVQKSFDGKTWTAAASTTRPSATVTGLDDGRTVAFRVRAVNGLGAGAWSTSVTATPVSLPGAPTITAVESGNRTLQVTFDAPASDGGAAVERYEYTRDGGATWTAADGSPVELTGLVNGTEYVVQVRAVTVVGTGPASARATGTPRPAPVQVPGEDGSPARPRVDPGVVRGWVGDETTPLVVGVRDGRRTVSGPGFDVVLGGSDAAGVQLPVDPEGRIIVGAGGFVDVAGSGFAPGEQVDVWLFSTPVLLGTVAVDADGAFDDRLALPLGVLPGVHTLQLNGARADGELVSIAAGIVVRAAADEPVAPGASRPEDDTLAVTGTSTGPGALLALWLLVVGGGAVIVARRRTRQR
ncbi:fibronectin type III domain-containing protein [Cellulomonas sp. A375-1]|uniref:fibronectin type III domain-containing protein n=1 Tax=Cellulomonas sp. A375-1 TaxID=1672219 RepID=UPI00065274D4|nr:fibronectin type III domain-containing protein [Cellulomonas sp. A375-1]